MFKLLDGHLWNSTTWTVTIYVMFGLAWVCSSDLILYFTDMQPAVATLFSLAKGSLFFILTSPILYWRLRSDVLSLSKTNELLRAVTEGTTDAVFVKNREGKYLLVNQAATRFAGVSSSEIIGHDDRAIFEPASADKVMATDRRVMDSASAITTEETLTIGGVSRVFLVSKAPFFDYQGGIAGIIGISRDISESKKSQAIIQEREQLLVHVTDAAQVGLVVVDAEYRYLFANRAYAVVLGLNSGDIVGRHVPDILPNAWSQIQPQLDRALAGERVSYELKVASKIDPRDTRRLRVNYEPRLSEEGKRTVVVVVIDMTEKAEALDALREQRDRFERLVETSPAVICSFQLTASGHFCFPYASKKIEDIYGVPAETLRHDATAVFAMTHPDDLPALRESINISARDMTVWNAEFRIKHPERGDVWVEGRSSPVRSSDGSTIWHGFIADITERKLSEVALKESEWRFRRVFEHARTGIGITDADGKFLQGNPVYCGILGLTEDELRKADFGSLIHPEDREENVALLRRLAAGEIRGYEIENRFLHSSGRPVWVHKIVCALEGEPGRASLLMALVTDVTERRRAEQVLREGEERLRLAVEAGDLGVWEYDPVTDVAIRSLRHDQMFGYDEPQPIWGMQVVMKHLHADDRELYLHAMKRGLETGEFSVQMRVRWPDGSIHWLDARGRTEFDASNQPVRMRGVVADVTDRVRAAESLRSVLASVTDAILTIDQEGRIETANPATQAMFGYPVSEIIGKNVSMLMPAPYHQQHDNYIANYLRTGQKKVIGKGRSVLGLRSDGATFPADLTVSEFRLDETRRFTGVVRDNSARERLESQLRQSHKMEAIGRLAGGVAHDFNNLLTVINGYAELLLDELATDENHRSSLLTIREAGQRAAALTSQLLAFSRKAIVAPHVFDLVDVIRQSDRLLRRLLGEDIAMDLCVPTEPCWVLADANQIHQVIMNLAVNARDAMPRGGSITINIRCIELTGEEWPTWPTSSTPPSGRYVELLFADTGVGMSEDIQTRIFEPFFTTKAEGEGTGLGLSTVFGIVQQAGGHISVTSEVGKGTQFKLLFPLSSEPKGTAQVETLVSTPDEGGKLVLLVEDDASVRRLSQRSLEAHGYVVISAADGHEALELVEKLPLGVDLLVTDVIMPEISGSELAEKIRSRWPETKVLFMSGYTDDAVIRHGVQEELVAFLQKPFIPSELVSKVRKILET